MHSIGEERGDLAAKFLAEGSGALRSARELAKNTRACICCVGRAKFLMWNQATAQNRGHAKFFFVVVEMEDSAFIPLHRLTSQIAGKWQQQHLQNLGRGKANVLLPHRPYKRHKIKMLNSVLHYYKLLGIT